MSGRSAAWDAAAAELEGLRDLWPADVPQALDPAAWAGTLGDRLDRWARERPETTAIHFYGADTTYAELERQVAACAGWLAARGVRPGDRVGVYLANCPQFIVAFLAILRLRAVHVPVNPMFKAAELAHELDDARPRALLAQAEFRPVVQAAAAELGLRLEDAQGAPAGDAGAAGDAAQAQGTQARDAAQPSEPLCVGYTQLGDALPGPAVPAAPFGPADPALGSDWAAILASPPAPAAQADPDALAALNYTGGTTGLPKGCEHTQAHMLYTAVSSLAGMGLQPGAGGQSVLGFLPIFWIAGEDFCILNPIVDGSTLVLMTRWHPEAALALIESQAVTTTVAMADNYVELMELPGFAAARTDSLAECMAISFVRKLDPQLRAQWRAATGTVLHEASFGMTETHTADTTTHGLDADDQDLRAEPIYCGYPVPGTRILVVDDDLVPVPAGTPGQIIESSPSVLTRYFNRPEATAQQLVDGWLLTGDTGRFDDHGALTYLSRTKEMIKVSGMSVFPAEVESLFKDHPDIVRIAVAPREDAAAGQIPVAFIEAAPGSTTSAEQFRAWAAQRMAVYKVPEVHLVDAMPMTATGKIRKVELIAGLEEAEGA
ncbi:AMP-binding protein [Brevibacterium sp. 5221]|uniref:AMP-binding protein n=1 Tax=Brevibacterium rongguiense TaxID=2695267 RepID=A0A6N9H7T0_9MICO|nr:AMP-binding protein [Brevibacterium rongguiense]MYM19622.1 AMP-binding protein [Brevibacterium rongguiense]